MDIEKKGPPKQSKLLERSLKRKKQITSDTDLVDAMVARSPRPEKEEVFYPNLNHGASEAHGSSNNFYHEDEDLPLGPSFTLLPPYVQI